MTKSSTAIAILAPILALGVPIMDTLLAMIRRTLARQSIFQADRGHIHHKLLDLGLTTRRVVLTLYGFSSALAFAAVAIAFGRSWHVGMALTVVGVLLFGIVRMVRGIPMPRPMDAPRDLRARVESTVVPTDRVPSGAVLRVAPAQISGRED